MKDREFLCWMHQRLVSVHHESEFVDYMHKFRAIIAATPADQETPSNGRGGDSLEDLRARLAYDKHRAAAENLHVVLDDEPATSTEEDQ